MTNAFTRFLGSTMLAAALVIPMGHMLMPAPVHAEALDTEDFFDESFTDNTGLGDADLKETIGNLIRVLLGFLGVVAVVIMLLGGFKWMTAGGNDEKVAEAKKLIIAGIIGLAIILSAYAIAEFVISSIVGATQD